MRPRPDSLVLGSRVALSSQATHQCAKGELVGKFMTYYKAPHVFRDTEIDLAVTIARQLGFSVERLNAVDAEHRARERQALLAREVQHRTKNNRRPKLLQQAYCPGGGDCRDGPPPVPRPNTCNTPR